MTPAPSLAVFFHADGKPTFSLPAQEVGNLAPPGQLAWHLLQPRQDHSGFRQAARAMIDGTDALENASRLFHEVLRREFSGFRDSARDLWPFVHAAWRRVCRRRAPQEALVRMAECRGLPEPAALARQVLWAIRAELLPCVHALLAYDPNVQEPMHQAFHLQLFNRSVAEAEPTLLLWKSLSRGESLERARTLCDQKNYRTAAEIFQDCLADAPADEQASLVQELASCSQRALEEIPDDNTWLLHSWIKLLTTDDDYHQNFIEIRRTLAKFHLHFALAKLKRFDDFRAAASHLAHSYTLDPADPSAMALLDGLSEAADRVRTQIGAALDRGGQLNERWQRLSRQDCDPQEVAASFLESREGKAILAQSVTLQERDQEAFPASPEREEIPVRPGVATDAVLAKARQALARAPRATKAPSRLNAWEAHSWIFSPMDWWAKGLLIGGLVLALLGMQRSWLAAAARQRRDVAYRGVMAALGRADDAAVIATARAFFDRGDSFHTDGRTGPVARAYAQALWHELSHAATTGDTNRTRLLSAEAQELMRRVPALSQEKTL